MVMAGKWITISAPPSPLSVHVPHGRGRPKSITDMRVYKAQKQREYRAKSKPDA